MTEAHRRADDEYLSRREAELLLEARKTATEQAKDGHDRQHEAERGALEKALEVANRDRGTHDDSHDREHNLHSEKHTSEGMAVHLALEAVARERTIHAEAHERDHHSHQREHALAGVAIEKAERATDLRFNAANAFREQLNVVMGTLTTKDAFDTFQKDSNRRFEELRLAVTNLEKGDMKSEGRGIGQGTVIAAIVAAVSVVGGLVGMTVVLANFVTPT